MNCSGDAISLLPETDWEQFEIHIGQKAAVKTGCICILTDTSFGAHTTISLMTCDLNSLLQAAATCCKSLLTGSSEIFAPTSEFPAEEFLTKHARLIFLLLVEIKFAASTFSRKIAEKHTLRAVFLTCVTDVCLFSCWSCEWNLLLPKKIWKLLLCFFLGKK